MSSPAITQKPLPVYRRRKPESTVLYQVLQEHLGDDRGKRAMVFEPFTFIEKRAALDQARFKG